MGQPKITRLAVIGTGYMGTRHALKCSRLSSTRLIAVVDIDEARARAAARELDCQYFTSASELLASAEFDAAIISTPTVDHYPLGKQLLSAGKHCLIEKPLAQTAAQAAELAHLATQHGVILIPGHIERFNPAISAVVSESPSIHYMKSHRVGPNSFRSTDIDVIDDVLIHDLDLLLYLTRSTLDEVVITHSIASPAGLSDVINTHVKTKSGCFADLTASRLGLQRRREIRLFCPDAYYSIDCGKRTAHKLDRLRYFNGLADLRALQMMNREPTAEEVHSCLGVESLVNPTSDPRDALELEISYFLDLISGNCHSIFSAMDGVHALEFAESLQKSIAPENTCRPGKSRHLG